MLDSKARRSARLLCEKVTKAARAAATARSTSAAVAIVIWPAAFSVAGLTTFTTLPPNGLTHSPAMYSLVYSLISPSKQVRSLLGDHDGRRILVASRDGRHDGRVHDAQALETMHPQLGIHDRVRVVAYRSGAH